MPYLDPHPQGAHTAVELNLPNIIYSVTNAFNGLKEIRKIRKKRSIPPPLPGVAVGVSEKALLRRQNLSIAWNNEQKSLVRTEGKAEQTKAGS